MSFVSRWQPLVARLRPRYRQVIPWLDGCALFAWGLLMVKKYFTGGLSLLIHPNYFGLVLVAGWLLVALGIIVLARQVQEWRSPPPPVANTGELQHITLFPLGVGTLLLLPAAIAGLLIPPRILGSETAVQRGITESNLPYTQTQVQSFYNETKPEDRSLLDWVRTLNAYPEPDAYTDQPARVTGFVVHSEALPDNYLLIARFTIACCAVDASPIGLPVKLPGDRAEYPPDTWLQLSGTMATATLDGQRQLVIEIEEAGDIEEIPAPANPYESR